ncbi:peptidase [Neokomagataea thailandica NBRC 106555]|uniref:Insulinase family protein n=2 Tax=Neokomagataea TaxID=1223423 RepID=A0A4Y6V8U1_9PROT|nr:MULTISPECIES: pitrilysin family protein [Neokomagataea]QDH25764.1 insulinase family protein [Neokomagataea tanensis]GBR52883.1 peptidase [Neokomagataea thailandica NBRC 106555]
MPSFARFPRAALLAASILASPVFISSHANAQATSGAQDESNVTRATLSNGLKIVIVSDPLAPVVQTMINYETGSVNAPKGFSGTAHALEHMMFNGSQSLSRDQLSTISAQLGNNDNADTTSDVTQYYFTAPAANLDVPLQIEAGRMRGLNITDAEWAHEKGAIEQEVSRDLSSPFYRMFAQIRGIIFKDTPYEEDALGSRPSFDKTTATTLRTFYNQWYGPNNATLVITGDVNPKAALAQAEAAFGKIPAITLPKRPEVHPEPIKAQAIKLDTDLPATFLVNAWQAPGARDKDYAAFTLLADVLGSNRADLFGLVPSGKALGTGFEYDPDPQAGLAFSYAALPSSANPEPLRQAIAAVFAHYRQNGIPEDLIEAARRKEIASIEFNANSISSLANTWSQALTFNHLSSPQDMITAFHKVTKAQIDELAKKLLDPEHMLTVTLTPNNKGVATGAKGFGGAESFSSPPSRKVALPSWATNALSRLTLPPAAAIPTAYTLSNGIRLIVQPEHVSHTVVLQGMIRQNADLQEPSGKEGLSSLTSSLFLFGSKQHDRLALARAFDDLAASETAGASFSVSALSDAFPKALNLLAEHELNPAFPAQAFRIEQTQAAQSTAGLMQSPSYKFNKARHAALVPANDPTLREATPKTIMGLTLPDVQNYYAATYRPDLTTIVVIGDITPEAARDEVEKAFGGWKAQGPMPQIDLPTVPLSKSSKINTADPGRSQDEVHLSETIGLNVNDPQHYALTVGNTILGEGFSSLLMQDLRVKTGYVYGVGSSFNYSRTRASFSISFGSDPSKVSKAREHALQDVETMRVKPVSDDTLNLAKAALLRDLPIERSSFDGLADNILSLSSLGRPLDTPNRMAQAIYTMTPQQVQAAFAQWVRPNDLAQAVLGPAPQ